MKIQIASYFLLAVALNGCYALKTLSSKNNPPAAATEASTSSTFIDGISVTPGVSNEAPVAVKSRRGNNTTTAVAPKRVKPVNANPGETNPAILQMKYATILDVSPDKLNNIPLLQNIDHWWGTQYCLGGSTEDCIDCSGFTQTILRDVYSLYVPRTAEDQYDSTDHVNDNQLVEGDLVFFHTTGRGRSINHVGVYVANNHFAHAATTTGVTIASLDDPYWKERYVAAGRAKKSQ